MRTQALIRATIWMVCKLNIDKVENNQVLVIQRKVVYLSFWLIKVLQQIKYKEMEKMSKNHHWASQTLNLH